jgi:hypothetical protein
MKMRTIRGEDTQDDGRGPSSIDRSQASSSAYLTSAGSRRISSAGAGAAGLSLDMAPLPGDP